jgi:hypothetical protein
MWSFRSIEGVWEGMFTVRITVWSSIPPLTRLYRSIQSSLHTLRFYRVLPRLFCREVWSLDIGRHGSFANTILWGLIHLTLVWTWIWIVQMLYPLEIP